MPDQVRKCKMISLRLSEVEYETLHALYPRYGARNVSDFARLAMQRIIGDSVVPDGAFAAKIRELDDRLNIIENRVTLLLEREKELA